MQVTVRAIRQSERFPDPSGDKATVSFELTESDRKNGDIGLGFYRDHYYLTNASARALATELLKLTDSVAHLVRDPYIVAVNISTYEERDYEQKAKSFNLEKSDWVIKSEAGDVLDTLPAIEWTVTVKGI